jgi:hypothetical protein
VDVAIDPTPTVITGFVIVNTDVKAAFAGTIDNKLKPIAAIVLREITLLDIFIFTFRLEFRTRSLLLMAGILFL